MPWELLAREEARETTRTRKRNKKRKIKETPVPNVAMIAERVKVGRDRVTLLIVWLVAAEEETAMADEEEIATDEEKIEEKIEETFVAAAEETIVEKIDEKIVDAGIMMMAMTAATRDDGMMVEMRSFIQWKEDVGEVAATEVAADVEVGVMAAVNGKNTTTDTDKTRATDTTTLTSAMATTMATEEEVEGALVVGVAALVVEDDLVVEGEAAKTRPEAMPTWKVEVVMVPLTLLDTLLPWFKPTLVVGTPADVDILTVTVEGASTVEEEAVEEEGVLMLFR